MPHRPPTAACSHWTPQLKALTPADPFVTLPPLPASDASTSQSHAQHQQQQPQPHTQQPDAGSVPRRVPLLLHLTELDLSGAGARSPALVQFPVAIERLQAAAPNLRLLRLDAVGSAAYFSGLELGPAPTTPGPGFPRLRVCELGLSRATSAQDLTPVQRRGSTLELLRRTVGGSPELRYLDISGAMSIQDDRGAVHDAARAVHDADNGGFARAAQRRVGRDGEADDDDEELEQAEREALLAATAAAAVLAAAEAALQLASGGAAAAPAGRGAATGRGRGAGGAGAGSSSGCAGGGPAMAARAEFAAAVTAAATAAAATAAAAAAAATTAAPRVAPARMDISSHDVEPLFRLRLCLGPALRTALVGPLRELRASRSLLASDGGLHVLAQALGRTLQVLDVSESTLVTDAGLLHVAYGCPALRSLDVSATGITDWGVRRLVALAGPPAADVAAAAAHRVQGQQPQAGGAAVGAAGAAAAAAGSEEGAGAGQQARGRRRGPGVIDLVSDSGGDDDDEEGEEVHGGGAFAALGGKDLSAGGGVGVGCRRLSYLDISKCRGVDRATRHAAAEGLQQLRRQLGLWAA
ncbi:hypothetical protein HXX76_007525 [Chlamydomonas incerta]|uniref:Uncharacterized protein n=1 Tax=Chlamydomonas incerta TaxID=51695 RepID=A0A835TAJ7_CHLIN|nr:hypothetical protein HXX76_007525 [Chlamydomonas incerta]|eukprot:KAG2434631.1 hypothetical protein HXX76_007525 [Chlamydomonas incerta]